MKKILLFILLISTAVFSQYKRENKIVIRGDDQKLYFNYNEDLRSDTLTFVVKADTSITSPRLIQKISTNTAELKTRYLANQTYITIVLQAYDTGDLNAGRYWYDIKRKHNDDTTTIFMGWFDLWSAVGTPFDGTALPGGTRFYTAGAFIDSTTQDSSLFMWDEATQSIVTVPYQSYIGAITDTILSGTATIPAGNNSVVVTHGLGTTPSIKNMNVWCYDWSRGNEFKIVNINSTTFTILLDSTIALDTVTYDLHYSWQIFNTDLSQITTRNYVMPEDYGDRTTAIQMAIDSGKPVYFNGDKVYEIDSTIILRSNLKLYGNGTIIRLANNSNCNMFYAPLGLENILIEGINFNGNSSNQIVVFSNRHCIYADSIKNIKIINCRFDSITSGAIAIRDLNGGSNIDIEIASCTFKNIGWGAILLSSCQNVRISNNSFDKWGLLIQSTANAINFWTGGREAIITNNNFNDNVYSGGFGIEAYLTLGEYIDGMVITSNTFGKYAGISTHIKHSIISNNTFINGDGSWHSGMEITGTHNIIANNVINNGIIDLVSHTGYTTEGNTLIENNRIINKTGTEAVITCTTW